MWAQRKDTIWVTVNLTDIEKVELDIQEEGKLSFKGESAGQKYGFDMELNRPIDKEGSSFSTKGRHAVIRILKKEDDREEYWPSLEKVYKKNAKLTIDWSKWVDEDEADEAPEMQQGEDMQNFGGQGGMGGGMPGGMGGMPGGMGGMPGMGGMGGMPGMGGAGGAGGGMDMAALQQMMGGMGGGAGGAGGPGGMDMEAM
jgi:hypothetical protein